MAKDKRAERHEDAAVFLADGHAVYAYTGQVTNIRDFGPKADIASDIEAIESAGWHLDSMAWSGIAVLLIFRAA
jgi:hypothetical protein